MSPPLPSRAQGGSPAQGGLSHFIAACGAHKRAPEKPRAGARLALKGMCGCVCGMWTHGGWDPCVCLEVRVRTQMEALCVCACAYTRPWAVLGGRQRRQSKMQQAGHGYLLLMPPACKARPRSTATERECDPRRENGVLGSRHRSLHPLPSEAETQPPPPWILRVTGSLPRRLPRGLLPPSPPPPGTEGGVGTGERSSTRPLLTHLHPVFLKDFVFLERSRDGSGVKDVQGRAGCANAHTQKGKGRGHTGDEDSGLRGVRRDANSEGQVNSWREHVETAGGTADTGEGAVGLRARSRPGQQRHRRAGGARPGPPAVLRPSLLQPGEGRGACGSHRLSFGFRGSGPPRGAAQ